MANDPERLLLLLKIASVINRPMLDYVAAPAKLSLNELRLLVAVAHEGETAAHALAELMGMQPMTVSRAVTALRERDYLSEAPDPGNRRRKVLKLTRKGMACYRRTLPDMADVADRLFGALSASQRETLTLLLGETAKALEAW